MSTCTLEERSDQFAVVRSGEPTRPLHEVIEGLAQFRPVGILVDPSSSHRLPPGVWENGRLLHASPEEVAPVAPRLFDRGTCSAWLPLLEDSDGYVAYFGSSMDVILAHLKNLSIHYPSGEPAAEGAFLTLSKPSVLRDLVDFGDPAFPARLIDGIQAVMLESGDAEGWVGYSRSSIQGPLGRLGFSVVPTNGS